MRRSTTLLFRRLPRQLEQYIKQPPAPSTPPPLRTTPPSEPSAESLAFVNAMFDRHKPTWQLTDLLPPHYPNSTSTAPPLTEEEKVTPERLRHLLRLSGLGEPESKEHEDELISTLHDQLYFVKAIQEVDTTGVEPLVAIRDEFEEAKGVTLEDIEAEERMLETMGPMGEEEWDPLGHAERTVGRYFVVEGEMGEQEVVSVREDGEMKKVDDEGKAGLEVERPV